MMDSNAFGEKIKNFRKEKHLTQQALADMLYVSDKTISRWELGKGMPDISELPAISELLGVSIDDLICGEKTSPPYDGFTEAALVSGKIKRGKLWKIVLLAGAALAVCGGLVCFALFLGGVFSPVAVYYFEAEDADFSGFHRIEYPETAHGGASAGYLHTPGDTVKYRFLCPEKTNAMLGIMLNRPTPFTFEEKMLLDVNGKRFAIGNVPGTGFYGEGDDYYYAFVETLDVDVELKSGENEITFTVVDGNGVNLDYISLTCRVALAPLRKAYVFEAESIVPTGQFSIENTRYASGGKCIGWLNTPGEELDFKVVSDADADAQLEIFVSQPVDCLFEEKFALAVNGVSVTVGNVRGTGIDNAENLYYCFGFPATVGIRLKKGENSLKFTVLNGSNFDCIKLKTNASLTQGK